VAKLASVFPFAPKILQRMNLLSAMITEDRGGETHSLFAEWFVDGERSSMRREEESLPLNIRVRKMVTSRLMELGRSRTRATRDLSRGDWCNRLSADIGIGIGLSMVNAEFDLQVHSHLHVESLTRTTLYIVPPYTLF
jgi:hypothetical protein